MLSDIRIKKKGFPAMNHLLRLTTVSAFILVAFLGAQIRSRNVISMPWFTFDKASDFTYSVSRGVKVTNGVTNVTMRVINKGPTTMQSQFTNSMYLGGSFLSRGYNWIELAPAKEQVPFPGIVKSVDMWVWGGNYNWTLEVRLKDLNEYEYTLPLANLFYMGWLNHTLEIPVSIPQSEILVGGVKGLSVLKFRVTSAASERPDRFNVFFNTFKIITDTFRPNFDGAELESMILQETKSTNN